VENAMGVELTQEEKEAAAQLDTDADTALMQENLGSNSDTTADNTRQVAEELAGNEGDK
jgi:hypothetical protein